MFVPARVLKARRVHDFSYAFLALATVFLAAVYAGAVIDFFSLERIMDSNPASWLFLAFILSPSALLLILLAPIHSDWQFRRALVGWRVPPRL